MSLQSPTSCVKSGMPLARIKTIMKSSPDVENISTDALYAMGKSAELFISYLTQQAYQNSLLNRTAGGVEYRHLANVVNSEDIFGFLQEIIPHKITVREYYEIQNQGGKKPQSSDESSEESDSTATE